MRRIVLAAGALLLAACTASADLKQALQVTDVTTGWFDAGIVDGKNKLVPSISFRLKNGSDAEVSTAALNIVFRFVDTGEEQDNIFVQRVQFNGKQTDVMTIRSQTGYTGEPPQSRADMLRHTLFRDLDAQIYVRQSSSQWIELHRVRVARELLTH